MTPQSLRRTGTLNPIVPELVKLREGLRARLGQLEDIMNTPEVYTRILLIVLPQRSNCVLMQNGRFGVNNGQNFWTCNRREAALQKIEATPVAKRLGAEPMSMYDYAVRMHPRILKLLQEIS